MEDIFLTLFKQHWGVFPDHITLLPASGSARQYYRIESNGQSYIGTYHLDLHENQLFITFSKHFRQKGLHAPRVYCISEDGLAYIQEDLGNHMLLDIVEQERKETALNEHLMDLYRKSLKELLRFQISGHQGLDYSSCIPRPAFDQRCISWDLNYFKYCFLRLTGIVFSEEALENDFTLLTSQLCQVPADAFMFRDFQSRNIMVREEEVWFIDYQGGRQGALHYDVASLLYDAIIAIPDWQREQLLDYYIDELQHYRLLPATTFRQDYYRFVLVRLLQAMGAFGLRGLYERKQHFIDSIRPGLQTLTSLFESSKLKSDYPELRRIIQALYDPK